MCGPGTMRVPGPHMQYLGFSVWHHAGARATHAISGFFCLAPCGCQGHTCNIWVFLSGTMRVPGPHMQYLGFSVWHPAGARATHAISGFFCLAYRSAHTFASLEGSLQPLPSLTEVSMY